MAKKSFRAQKVPAPEYPKLVDVEKGSLRKWGLAALGGLLLGGGACTRTAPETRLSGEPPMVENAKSGMRNAQANPPDGGVVAVPAIPLGGAPPPQRVEPEPQAKTNGATGLLPIGREMRMSGGLPAARVKHKKIKQP